MKLCGLVIRAILLLPTALLFYFFMPFSARTTFYIGSESFEVITKSSCESSMLPIVTEVPSII